MKNWRKVTALLAGATLLFGATACSPNTGDEAGGESTANGEDPIILGLDEDSTGPGAAYMTITGATVRMAVDQINADGGVLGRQIEVKVGNDESDPTKTPSVLRKLVDDGADVIFLATGGGSAVQGKSIVKQEEILAIAPISVNSAVALPPDNEYTYMLANGLEDFTEVYCGAFEELGVETLGILSDTTPAIDGIAQMLVPGMEECVDIVADEKAPEDSADLNAQAARIKDADPDALMVMSVGGNFEVLAHNTLAPQFPGVKRFSLASLGNQPDSWSLAQPGVLSDVIYMGSVDEDNPRTEALAEKLKEVNGDDYRLTAYDAQAWDSVYLLKEAIEAAGGTDRAELAAAFQTIEGYEATFGQAGLTLSYSEDKHIGADSPCGLVLSTFDENNEPIGAWPGFQVSC